MSYIRLGELSDKKSWAHDRGARNAGIRVHEFGRASYYESPHHKLQVLHDERFAPHYMTSASLLRAQITLGCTTLAL